MVSLSPDASMIELNFRYLYFIPPFLVYLELDWLLLNSELFELDVVLRVLIVGLEMPISF
jgi:hypothetical protein